MFIMYENDKKAAFTHLRKANKRGYEFSEPASVGEAGGVNPLRSCLDSLSSLWLGKAHNPRIPSFADAHSSGFTLTEVIIVLVILGVLALILVPNMAKMVPDDHNIKYKKAFYTIQEIMDDITNDYSVCTGLDGDDPVNDDVFLKSCTGGNTLRYEIAKRLNTTESYTTTNIGDDAANNIKTTNNMIWYIPNVYFSTFSDSTQTITVSFDGNNAYSNGEAVEESDPNGIFEITINKNGKVTPGGDLGSDLLTKKATDD